MKNNPFKPDDIWKRASPKIFSNAKNLRERAIKAEEIMWFELRNNKLEGNIHCIFTLPIFIVIN
ncbi:MAG: very-short-patch-repair endonuclease [Polaribacter sp.]|jgi:very-short-patch-repair endonuclease